MSRYIDAEKGIAIARRYSLQNGTSLGKHSGVADIIAEELENAINADVVEVTRCEHCIYGNCETNSFDNDKDCVYCNKINESRGLNDFCSYGERKEKDDGEIH